MFAVMVVVASKAIVKGCRALAVVAIDRAIGPAAEQGADEALDVGLRVVGTRAQMSDTDRPAGDRYPSERYPLPLSVSSWCTVIRSRAKNATARLRKATTVVASHRTGAA